MKTTYGFSRRGPDRVAEEIANVLSTPESYEFKALFTVVFANLRARNAANGGEEMLRLRAYEKLQNLVQAGVIKRVGKEYQGVGPALANFLATAAELNAKFAAGIHNRPPSAPAVPAADVVIKSAAVAVVTKSPTVAAVTKSPALAAARKSAAVAVQTKSAAAKPVRRRTAATRPS